MKAIRVLATAILCSAVFFACDTTQPEPVLDPLSVDEIDAQVLWTRITEQAPYQDYSFWPGHDGERPGQSPHGSMHRIKVNKTLIESLPVSGAVPFGSIVVKDNLDAGRELASVTVMAKVEGFDPENGDWFWAAYSPDGEVVRAGNVSGCIECHEGVADNDYIVVRRIDGPVN